MAANVAVFASPNFVVAVKLAAAKFPPGADVVSMMPYVLFSARGSGDDEDDGVNDGVADVVRVKDGVCVGELVPDGELVRDGEFGGLPEPDGERVRDCVMVLLTEAPDDGVALGLNENSGAPRI